MRDGKSAASLCSLRCRTIAGSSFQAEPDGECRQSKPVKSRVESVKIRRMKHMEPRLTVAVLDVHRHHLRTLLLSPFHSIEDKAAARLPRQLGTIRTLADVVAERPMVVCPLYLTGLKSLTVAAAKGLAQHHGFLLLNGLTELPAGIARALGRQRGTLRLDGVAELSDQATAFLAKHRGLISKKEAKARLELMKIKSFQGGNIEDAKSEARPGSRAESLNKNREMVTSSGSEEYLGLGGVTSISEQGMANLSKHVGILNLSGLTEISERGAMLLSRHQGDLHLSGLRQLSDGGAEALSALRACLYLSREILLSSKASIFLSAIRR